MFTAYCEFAGPTLSFACAFMVRICRRGIGGREFEMRREISLIERAEGVGTKEGVEERDLCGR